MKKILKEIGSYFKKGKLSFIMIIITLLISFMFVNLGKALPFNDKVLCILLAFIPTIIFVILNIVDNKFYNVKSVKVISLIMSILSVFGSLIYFFILTMIMAFLYVDNPVTDIKYYKDFVNSKELLRAFPKKIPENAKDINFYYSPMVLQAGDVYSLSYIDDSLTLEEVNNRHKRNSKWVGKRSEYHNDIENINSFFVNTGIEEDIQDDYILYLYEDRCDDSGYCNHGTYMIVAYNENMHRIIYRTEMW